MILRATRVSILAAGPTEPGETDSESMHDVVGPKLAGWGEVGAGRRFGSGWCFRWEASGLEG